MRRICVALRKESVDRNTHIMLRFKYSHIVALRKESVDRNHVVCVYFIADKTSLSARRAWIEMSPLMWPWSPLNVALRKESVDRNSFASCFTARLNSSLSARRAWIEIILLESKDPIEGRRSPQGERG